MWAMNLAMHKTAKVHPSRPHVLPQQHDYASLRSSVEIVENARFASMYCHDSRPFLIKSICGTNCRRPASYPVACKELYRGEETSDCLGRRSRKDRCTDIDPDTSRSHF